MPKAHKRSEVMRMPTLRALALVLALATPLAAPARAAELPAPHDMTEPTADGPLLIYPINHGTVGFGFKNLRYYVDPAGEADWLKYPLADVIFITHQHGDHLDPAVLKLMKKTTTLVFANADSVKKLGYGTAIGYHKPTKVADITAEAIPAYNTTKERLKFHPKERQDNGYVLTFGGKRVYLAGDTEVTPEMKALKNIDVAFLPIDGFYTMDAKAAAEGARAFKPKVLIPYHQKEGDPNVVKQLLKDLPGIEVRVMALP